MQRRNQNIINDKQPPSNLTSFVIDALNRKRRQPMASLVEKRGSLGILREFITDTRRGTRRQFENFEKRAR